MPSFSPDEQLKRAVFLVVTAMWALAFAVDVFDHSFEVPSVVHGLMSLIIGYFVGTRFRRPTNDQQP